MGRKRTCELPFCRGVVEGTRSKRRCDNDRNIHLHQIISKNVKKIMRYAETRESFTANDVNRDLFKNRLDKNEKGSMYRLFQAMVREEYLVELDKCNGLKVYAYHDRYRRPSESEKVALSVPLSGEHVLTPREILIGKLREFVHLKNGSWNHDDWLALIGRQDIKDIGIPDQEIGVLLENEKVRYWLNR